MENQSPSVQTRKERKGHMIKRRVIINIIEVVRDHNKNLVRVLGMCTQWKPDYDG